MIIPISTNMFASRIPPGEHHITAIGCKDQADLRRFDTDEEMYRECDLVIVTFDSSYWEIYSKDRDLIDRMEKHFKDTERLPDL